MLPDWVLTFMYTLSMSQVISVTEARKNLLQLVDQVDQSYSRVDLTKNGKVRASLVSPDYLDSLEETIYSLKTSKNDIEAAEKEIKNGQTVSLEEVRKRFIHVR